MAQGRSGVSRVDVTLDSRAAPQTLLVSGDSAHPNDCLSRWCWQGLDHGKFTNSSAVSGPGMVRHKEKGWSFL